MSELRLTDAQLTTALRGYLPSAAPNGSAERLAAAIGGSRQQRRMPLALAGLTDADPFGRRRSLLIAAALLLLAAALSVAAAGALRLWAPSIPPNLSLDPPSDVRGYVSAVEDGPIVRPMAVTIVADRGDSEFGETVVGPVKSRVRMNGSGSVRIERFASPDATEPASYRIFTSDARVEATKQGAEDVWVVDPGVGDPRWWVADETMAYAGVPETGCDTGDPASVWRYVALEYVLDRPVHHVRCGGDLWIDVETRLILRSHGPLTPDGRPADANTRTIEVVALEFGDQPAALFDPTAPAGRRVVTPDEQRAYEGRIAAEAACAADPVCSAPTVPLVSPPPAPAQDAPASLDALVAAAVAARDGAPPLQSTVRRWRTKGGDAGSTQLFYDGPNRFRVEHGADPVAGTRADTQISVSENEFYATELDADGMTRWHPAPVGRNLSIARWMSLESTLLGIPEACSPGWRHLGVDQVGGFTTDHLACGTAPEFGSEYWIDRETHLVVRRQSVPDPSVPDPEIEVLEVVDLRFATSPDDSFRLPPGAVVAPVPMPDPDFIPTPAPQPAPAGG
jgi:hypothetical protein